MKTEQNVNEPASDEIIRTHQMACAARLECEELREALRKAVAWGESASRHILYRENINWRYLDEARAVLDKANAAALAQPEKENQPSNT